MPRGSSTEGNGHNSYFNQALLSLSIGEMSCEDQNRPWQNAPETFSLNMIGCYAHNDVCGKKPAAEMYSIS